MRHRNAGRKLGRNGTHRKAMWRNMVTSLLEHGRIQTTEPKAKELRGYVERTITIAIRVQDIASKPEEARSREEKARLVHATRMAGRLVRTKDVLRSLFTKIAPALKSRPGGYTRIAKIAPRAGDGAPMAIIELLAPGASAEAAA